jgi:hypothetical protein
VILSDRSGDARRVTSPGHSVSGGDAISRYDPGLDASERHLDPPLTPPRPPFDPTSRGGQAVAFALARRVASPPESADLLLRAYRAVARHGLYVARHRAERRSRRQAGRAERRDRGSPSGAGRGRKERWEEPAHDAHPAREHPHPSPPSSTSPERSFVAVDCS